jgi:hypothetical protein
MKRRSVDLRVGVAAKGSRGWPARSVEMICVGRVVGFVAVVDVAGVQDAARRNNSNGRRRGGCIRFRTSSGGVCSWVIAARMRRMLHEM